MIKWFRIVLMMMVLFCSVQLHAQEILKLKDLSKYNVDLMSDEDLLKYRDALQSAGITESQAEQIAIQKGLPSSEVAKLRARLARLTNQANQKATNNAINRYVDSSSLLSNPIIENKKNKTFGLDLFQSATLFFEPNLKMATPKNYVIGPDDELVIDVYGLSEVHHQLVVSPEGTINIPNIGIISVVGLNFEEAQKRIKDKMSKNGYSSLANGQSKLSLSVGKIRTIKVNVVGEVKRPGTYAVPSLANLFNALYAAGGPTEKGSLRKIQLVRNNKTIVTLDVYNFLMKGDQSQNIRLMEQDVIMVPVSNPKVTIKGEVMRPGIFELAENETLSQVLNYAGGFTDSAYTASVQITQINGRERQLKDVSNTAFNNYIVQKGDEIEVGKIINKFSNRVSIKGAVYRPGNFELTQGMSLKDLIEKADGVTEEAFLKRGLLIRTNPDQTKSSIAFDVASVINNKTQSIFLQKEDEVIINKVSDLKDANIVTIEGEVRNPGVYEFYEGMSVKDLIFQSGGFTDAGSTQRIEVSSRINLQNTSKKIAEVLEVNTDDSLLVTASEHKLKPQDLVVVRMKPGYRQQVTVRVEGEVVYPGTYSLQNKEERVSDVLKRAGGYTNEAFLLGVSITRVNSSLLGKSDLDQLQKIQQAIKDTLGSVVEDSKRPTVKISINVEEIMKNPGGLEDIILQEGDIITFPKARREVKINGEVLFPTEVVYVKGASLDYYIDKAGGFTDNARKGKVYVLNANGSAAKTKKFLFFRSYPKVLPGSEILVPKIAEKNGKGLSTTEIIAITSGIASLAGVVIAIINSSK